MIDREHIKSILEELKTALNLKDDIKLELRPMKTKAASTSLKRKTIRLNKNLIPNINHETIRYLILHELTHIKLNTIHHTKDFYNLLHSIIDKNTAKELEEEILAKLIKLNNYRSINYKNQPNHVRGELCPLKNSR